MKKTKRVLSNLIQQDVYVRDCRPAEDLASVRARNCYYSLDEVVVPTGVELRETCHDYPITPESVDSYLESSDYRNDIQSAMSMPSRGCGLGDVSLMQEILAMDSADARRFVSELQTRLDSVDEPLKSDVEVSDVEK